MSASPVARQVTQSQIIPSRRMVISSTSDLPNDYSTTPGGTFYSTTPGGKFKIFYLKYFYPATASSIISRQRFPTSLELTITWFVKTVTLLSVVSHLRCTAWRTQGESCSVMRWNWNLFMDVAKRSWARDSWFISFYDSNLIKRREDNPKDERQETGKNNWVSDSAILLIPWDLIPHFVFHIWKMTRTDTYHYFRQASGQV